MKPLSLWPGWGMVGRSPCGGRGLKQTADGGVVVEDVSLPMRGAWIETIFAAYFAA